jgi:hypothetical protein
VFVEAKEVREVNLAWSFFQRWFESLGAKPSLRDDVN